MYGGDLPKKQKSACAAIRAIRAHGPSGLAHNDQSPYPYPPHFDLIFSTSTNLHLAPSQKISFLA